MAYFVFFLFSLSISVHASEEGAPISGAQPSPGHESLSGYGKAYYQKESVEGVEPSTVDWDSSFKVTDKASNVEKEWKIMTDKENPNRLPYRVTRLQRLVKRDRATKSFKIDGLCGPGFRPASPKELQDNWRNLSEPAFARLPTKATKDEIKNEGEVTTTTSLRHFCGVDQRTGQVVSLERSSGMTNDELLRISRKSTKAQKREALFCRVLCVTEDSQRKRNY